MNRDFLSNFERPAPHKNTPGQEEAPVIVTEKTEFADNEYIRNVCFVWPEGKRKFLPYSRLDSGEINSDYDTVLLVFGAETVQLIGICLLPLFHSFMDHKRKFVYCDDARYNDLSDELPIVNEITILQEA